MCNPINAVFSVLEKIGDTVFNVVENIIENPLPTIATIALSAVGVPPVITNIASTALRGGSMEDMVLSLAGSYIGAELGSAASAEIFGDLPIEIAPEMASTATQDVFKTVITNASPAALSAAFRGESLSNILTSAVSSSVAGTIGKNIQAELGIDASQIDGQLLNNSINSATRAILNGQDVATAIGSAVANTGYGLMVGSAASELRKTASELTSSAESYNQKVAEANQFRSQNVEPDYQWVQQNRSGVESLVNQFNSERSALLDQVDTFNLAKEASTFVPRYWYQYFEPSSPTYKIATKLGYTPQEDGEGSQYFYKAPIFLGNKSYGYYDEWGNYGEYTAPEYDYSQSYFNLHSDPSYSSAYKIATQTSNLINDSAPKLEELSKQVTAKVDEFNNRNQQLQNNVAQFNNMQSQITEVGNRVNTLFAQRNSQLENLNNIVVQSLESGVDLSQDYAKKIVDEATKLVDQSTVTEDEALAVFRAQGFEPTKDQLRQIVGQKPEAGITQAVENIISSARQEQATTDAIQQAAEQITPPGAPITDVASSGTTATDVAPARTIEQLQEFVRKELFPGATEIYFPGQLAGLQAIVNKLREGGFEDEFILDYLKSEQEKSADNFIDLLISHAPQQPTGGQGTSQEDKRPAAGLAIGESATPPDTAGGVVIGGGSGQTPGLAIPSLIAVDSGKKTYDLGNGFTLFAFSDGKQQMMNNETGVIVELTSAEAAQNIDKLIAADAQAPLATEPVAKPFEPPIVPTQPETVPTTTPVVDTTPEPVIEPPIVPTAPPVEPVAQVPTQPTTPTEPVVAPPVIPPSAGPTPPAEVTPALTQKDLDDAIAKIQFPEGLKADDVKQIVQEAIANNPSLTANDVQQIVQSAVQNLPVAPTVTDIRQEINAATKDFATKADIESAISKIEFPQGITAEDVTSAVKSYMDANPGLKAQDVVDIVKGELQNLPQYATPNEIYDAVNKSAIALRGEITGAREDVRALETRISDLVAQAQAQGQSSDAALNSAINKVASDLGTSQASVLQELGKTKDELQQEFSRQFSVIGSDVQNVRNQLTDEINAARQAGLSGDAALQAAINNLSIDLGTSKEALLSQLGTTEAQLRQDVAQQISGVTSRVTDVESRLSAAIADAKAAGITGDAALQQAINNVASDLGTTKDVVLNQVGKTEQELRSEFSTQLGGVRQELGRIETDLGQAILDARASGKQGIDAVQAAVDQVAAGLGTTREDLLAKLGTTESQLRQDFASQLGGVQTQIETVQTRLQQEIQNAVASGKTGDAALQTAINKVSTDLGTTRDALLAQLGTTEAQLRQDVAQQLSGVSAQVTDLESRLSAAIAEARVSGAIGDGALQAGINKVASDLGTTKEELLSQLGTTESQLKADFASQLSGVTQQVTNVESRLTSAIAEARAAGQTGDAALQSGINQVAAELGTTKEQLLAQVGKTESQLRADMQAQVGGVESRLTAAIAEARQSGLQGDAALQAGINKVAADLSTTKDIVLEQVGKTESQLRQEMQAGQAQTGQQIADLNTSLQQAINQAQAEGKAGDAALQAGINKVAGDLGTTKEALLGQLGKTEQQLRSDFATQLGGVQAQIGTVQADLTKAIADAKAQGQSDVEAVRSAVNQVSTDLGITKDDLLNRLQETESSLQQKLESGQLRTQEQIQELSTTQQQQYQQLTQSQKQLYDQMVAQGASQTSALNTAMAGVQQQITTGLAGVSAEFQAQLAASDQATKTAFANMSAAQQAEAAARVAQGQSLQQSISDVQAGLGQQITSGLAGLSAEFQEKLAQSDNATKAAFASMSAAQQAEAAARVAQGESLQKSISDVQSGLGQQLTAGLAGVSAEFQAKLAQSDAATQAAFQQMNANQQAETQARVQQGQSLQTAISDVQATLGQQITTGLTDVESRLKTAMAANEAAGLSRDQAAAKAIDDVAASVGSTRSDLLSQIGKSEETIRGELTGVQAGLQTQITGVEGRLNAAIAANEQAGLQRDQAISKAVDDVAASVGTTKDDLLSRLGQTESSLRQQYETSQAQTQAQISQLDAATQARFNQMSEAQKTQALQLAQSTQDLQGAINTVSQQTTQQISSVSKTLSDQIAANEAAGLSRDAAISKSVQDVAASLGTTKDQLLAQIGTTEAGLRSEFETGIAGVQQTLAGQIGQLSQQAQEQYASLTDAQKAEVAARQKQGEDLTSAISSVSSTLAGQIGELSAATQQQFANLSEVQKAQALQLAQSTQDLQGAINTVSQQTTAQISSVSKTLSDQIAANEAAGLSRDAAITKSVEDVAASLGTTKDALLAQLGTTEQGLRAEFTTGLAGVEAGLTGQIGALSQQTQAQYAALSEAQKREVEARTQMGESLSDAIAGVSTTLTGRISELSTATQQQFANLTEAQKQEVAARFQQGQDLQDAISSVESKLGTKIETGLGGLESKLNDQGRAILAQLEQQGVGYQTALQTALAQQEAATQQAISGVSKELSDVQTQFNNRVDELIAQGQSQEQATQQAFTELRGSVSQLSAAQQAQATQQQAAQQQAAQQQASSANISLLGTLGLGLGGLGALGALPGAAGAAPSQAMKSERFMVGAAPQTQFEGPLEQFLKMSTTGYSQKPYGQQPAEEPAMNYYSYGQPSSIDNLLGMSPEEDELQVKSGGLIAPLMAAGGYAPGGLNVINHSGKARIDFRKGAHVAGPGDGQSDDIPAMLADGEFVFPADVVAALGNGSTKAGSDKLYEMMHSIRARARSAKPKDLPPPALKSPLDYLGRR